MSKFYHYSFSNTLLIAMQKPEATYVAGYTSWQRNFDRQVMKGEKGIKILAPAPYKAKEEREKIDTPLQRRATMNSMRTCPAVWTRRFSAEASFPRQCLLITSGSR